MGVGRRGSRSVEQVADVIRDDASVLSLSWTQRRACGAGITSREMPPNQSHKARELGGKPHQVICAKRIQEAQLARHRPRLSKSQPSYYGNWESERHISQTLWLQGFWRRFRIPPSGFAHPGHKSGPELLGKTGVSGEGIILLGWVIQTGWHTSEPVVAAVSHWSLAQDQE